MWCDEHTEPATEATGPSGWILSTLASEQVVNLRDQVKRLKVRMKKLNGHREDAAESDELKLQLDMVSVAFLVRMPSKEEENEDGVLPELVWMGVRGRRRLDQLEASQWEEGELDELEPNVDYGEKPVIFNIHVKESERSNDNVSSATPLSVWLDTTQGPGHTKHPPDPSARREASYIERLKRRLRREKMDRQHGIESSGTQQGLKSTSVSIAFLIAMPSEEKGTEKADGSVLPELVVGIDDIHVS
ncbi:hypothetical protein FRC04_001538 [Tulasnella sp. 424]|nr:hypothetical protein FRC04_001538 [Tulasnella sp. 424]